MWMPTGPMGGLAPWPSSAADAAASSSSSAFAASSSFLLPPLLLQTTYDPPLLAHVPAAALPGHGHQFSPAAPPSPSPWAQYALPAAPPAGEIIYGGDQGAAGAGELIYSGDQGEGGAGGGQEIVPDLPMGFRFCPSDRVLVLQYLLNKLLRRPTPADVILDIGDIYKFDADQLPRAFRYPMKGECYFYTRRTKRYPNGSRPSRSTPSGYWKATGGDADVVRTKDGLVGTRKSLVFYFGRSPAAPGRKTNWIMHEYRISSSTDAQLPDQSRTIRRADPTLQWDSYVLCKVYERAIRATMDSEEPIPELQKETAHDSLFLLPTWEGAQF